MDAIVEMRLMAGETPEEQVDHLLSLHATTRDELRVAWERFGALRSNNSKTIETLLERLSKADARIMQLEQVLRTSGVPFPVSESKV